MKMRYILAPLFIVIIFISNAHAVRADVFTKDLYYGIQGDSDVKQLQEFLTSQGVYSGPISGNFFSLTLAGVKQLQSANGITPAAGYFGPITRSKVNTILSQQLQASNNQAITETSSTPPTPTPPATTNDINNSLQSQINLLTQQIALLQAQLQTQQSSTQTIQNIQTQVQQQTQTIQQIQQNTQQIQQNTTPQAPTPTPTPTPMPTTYTPPLTQIDFNSITNISTYQGADFIRFSFGNLPLSKNIEVTINGQTYNTTSTLYVTGLQTAATNASYPYTVKATAGNNFGTYSGTAYTGAEYRCDGDYSEFSFNEHSAISCYNNYYQKTMLVSSVSFYINHQVTSTIVLKDPAGNIVFNRTYPLRIAPNGDIIRGPDTLENIAFSSPISLSPIYTQLSVNGFTGSSTNILILDPHQSVGFADTWFKLNSISFSLQ